MNNHHLNISINGNVDNNKNVKKKKSILHQSDAPFPTPMSSLSTFKKPFNRKRSRESIDNCSKSPNINDTLKRQRRKITATTSEQQTEQIQNSSTSSNLAPPTLISLSPSPRNNNIIDNTHNIKRKSYKNGKKYKYEE